MKSRKKTTFDENLRMSNLLLCRFCNSDQIIISQLIDSPHFNLKYQLYKCNTCNSKFFNPSEHDVSLNEMYQKFSNEQKENILIENFKKDKVWVYQKNIITKILKKNPESVLDVGCRTGNFLMHFGNNTIKAGVELSREYSKVCERRGIETYCDFVENITFPKKYDVVSCYALLEHVVEPVIIIKQLKSLVKKDGVLVIMIPWHECFKEKVLRFFGIRWHMYSPPEHFNFFSKKILNDIIEKSNDFKLEYKYSSSGGIFNPFKKIPLLNKAFGYFMFLMDKTFLNQIPIFDHLYLYYKRVN